METSPAFFPTVHWPKGRPVELYNQTVECTTLPTTLSPQLLSTEPLPCFFFFSFCKYREHITISSSMISHSCFSQPLAPLLLGESGVICFLTAAIKYLKARHEQSSKSGSGCGPNKQESWSRVEAIKKKCWQHAPVLGSSFRTIASQLREKRH